MNYAWLEASMMSLIFVAATLFAIKHFLPGFFVNGRRLLTRKNNHTIDINLVATTTAGSCQTKCSACNGCSMARK